MTFVRANPRTLSRSLHIAAPPVKVWELITTVARVTDWYDTWDAVEHAADEERLQVGTSFRLIRHGIGRDDAAVCRVVSLEAPSYVCWLQRTPQLPPMSVEFHLVPDAEGGTGTWVNHTRTWLNPGQPLS